jgi:hypothetical protein
MRQTGDMREKITPQKAVRKWEQDIEYQNDRSIECLKISGSIRYTTNVVNITCQRLPASHCQTGYY